ncbi:unnamed protein product [Durusdinium trenchii]|uniref:SRCR domain-containing protein n=1 Tax=Durusdinium trenchii TaxID=1381693 RepID=A0ABP0NJ21_9DINO
MSNTSMNDTEEVEPIPFPCEVGAFDSPNCSEAFGCDFGATVQGGSTNNIFDAWQIYDTWEECQQRCCHDQDCFAVSYDTINKYCKKHSERQDHQLTTSDTDLYAPVVSREPSTDGFKPFRGRVEFQGIQVGAYPGHRSVTFCKERCAAEPMCNHIIWHETRGCFLRSQCIDDNSIRGDVWNADDQHWTFYKIQGRCADVWDWSDADRSRVLFPSDPYGSTVSTITNGYPHRRRQRYSRYSIGKLTRTAFSAVTVQARLLEELPRFRRLSSNDPCVDNCTSFCSQDTSDEIVEDCQSDCLWTNCGLVGNFTSTVTQTSTTTTTLPPPPVRLVQLSGDLFNVGDSLPSEGHVAGRVEVFYNGEWGTAPWRSNRHREAAAHAGVCSDGFDDVEATVVCNELGLTSAGPGAIWIDDIDCVGDESHLSLCAKADWGVSNCFHSEDAKATLAKPRVWCESTSTTVTTRSSGVFERTQTTTLATTSTTTAFPTVMVTPRSGFLRQDLTGRCLSPASCTEAAALTVQEGGRPWVGDPWVTEEDDVRNHGKRGLPGHVAGLRKGVGVVATKVLRERPDLVSGLRCEELRRVRWIWLRPEPVERQVLGPLVGTKLFRVDMERHEDSNSDGVVGWTECELEVSCNKKGMKFDPLNMDGAGANAELRIEKTEQPKGSAIMLFDNNAWSGPPTCAEAISMQKWSFVELDVTQASTKGLLRNAGTMKCMDPTDLDPTILELQSCITQMPTTDQLFQLSGGELRNLQNGLCVNVTDAEEGSDLLPDPTLYMTTCDGVSTSNLFALDSQSRLVVAGDRCVNSTSGDNGAGLVSVVCSSANETTNMTLSWEFVDTAIVAERCSQICQLPTDIWDIWMLYNNDLDCECGHLFRQDFRWNYVQEGILGSTELSGSSRFGLLSPPDISLFRLEHPVSVLSSLTPAFQPGFVEVNSNMSLGIFSPTLSIPKEIPESGDEPTTPFGFSYLSEAQQPYIDVISVNGNSDWVNYTVNMVEGDSVVIQIRNFDGLMDADVKVYLGLVVVPTVTLTETTVSFTAPLTTHGETEMKIMAGWKGWADYAPFLGTGMQQDTLMIQFDNLNEVTAITPDAGSMQGGAQVTITGRGFKLPGLSNSVVLYHHGGSLIGQMAGAARRGRVQREQRLSDQYLKLQERVDARVDARGVNGQTLDSSGNDLLFTYSRPLTPIVLEVLPEVPWISQEVTSRGYAVARNSSYLDTRFEIHSVDPPVGSEEGGSRVTVRGVGFGNKQLTPQLTIAALGTLGDVESWSDTEATELGEGNRTRGDLTEGDGKVVFVTRKLTLNVEKVGTTTTTTMGQNFTIRRLNVLPSEDCNHKAFRAYATPNITAISSISGNEGDMITFTVSMPSGYIDAVSNAVVSVHFGTHVCPHNVTAKTGDDLTARRVMTVVAGRSAGSLPVAVVRGRKKAERPLGRRGWG